MTISVIDNISNGKYIDAMGDVILSVADFNIGLYLDVATTIIHIDCVQNNVAKVHAVEYERLAYFLGLEQKKEKPDVNKVESLKKSMKLQRKLFENCYNNMNK